MGQGFGPAAELPLGAPNSRSHELESSGFRPLDRTPDKSGDSGAQQLIMTDIPREDLIRAHLDGTAGNQRIVDGPTGNAVRGCLPNTGETLVALKADEAESAMDTFQKLDSPVSAWRDAAAGAV